MTNRLDPIFVGGTGRSGTTIVFEVLSSGNGIVATVPELRLHVDPGGALDLLDALTTNWSPYQADGALKEFHKLVRSCRRSSRATAGLAQLIGRYLPLAPWRYPGMALGRHFGNANYERQFDVLVERLSTGKSKGYWAGTPAFTRSPSLYEIPCNSRKEVAAAIGDYFGNLYNGIASSGDVYWAESTPYSILHAESLLEIFPDAKFIHVVRSPLDIVASYVRMHWGGEDAVVVARRIKAIFDRWWTVRDRLADSKFVEVRLEDIVQDPTAAWSRIAEFLGKREGYDFDLGSIRADSLHGGRWKSELAESTAGEAMRILAPVIERYNYE